MQELYNLLPLAGLLLLLVLIVVGRALVMWWFGINEILRELRALKHELEATRQEIWLQRTHMEIVLPLPHRNESAPGH